MRVPMSVSQIAQVQRNLAACTLTPSSEKAAIKSELDKAVSATAPLPPSKRLIEVSKRIRTFASKKKLILQGPPATFVVPSKEVVHSTRRDRLQGLLLSQLVTESDYPFDDADTLVSNLLDELQMPAPWPTLSRPTIKRLALHRAGSLFWVGDPDSGKPGPSPRFDLYPARAGLHPDAGEYLFLRLKLNQGSTPRFADSGAYPYWRPGGKTQPISGCPAGYSGFDEAVAKDAKLSNLSSPMKLFKRKI